MAKVRSAATDPSLGYRFVIKIDGHELGPFTEISGLSAKYDMMTVKEGGENAFVHQLPGRMTYENLKLSRPVDELSGDIAAWFSEFKEGLQTGGRVERVPAAVTAFGPDNQPRTTWTLDEVTPVRYTGPTFKAGSSNVLTESIELAHHGFVASRRA